MIDALKAELANIDRDLAPVLAHVAAAQARRAGIVSAIERAEAVAAITPVVEVPPEPVVEAVAEPVADESEQSHGKRRR